MRKTNYTDQARTQCHVIPLAMPADVHITLALVVNRAIKNEKHSRYAQQHTKYIAVSHVHIIADAWPETRKLITIGHPQNQGHDNAEHCNEPFEVFKS